MPGLTSMCGWQRNRSETGHPARNLHQPQIDQIAGTLMMVRSPRVWSCSASLKPQRTFGWECTPGLSMAFQVNR